MCGSRMLSVWDYCLWDSKCIAVICVISVFNIIFYHFYQLAFYQYNYKKECRTSWGEKGEVEVLIFLHYCEIYIVGWTWCYKL